MTPTRKEREPSPSLGKPNRTAARAARLGKSWCGGCDRQIVAQGGAKCPLCGRRNGNVRDKKPGRLASALSEKEVEP